MSIFAWFKKVFAIEHDILASLVKGAAMTEAELVAGITWVSAHKAQIAETAQGIAAIIASLVAAGVGVPPAVTQAIELALAAVGALTAINPKDAETLVASYVALKNAYNSLNDATIAVAQLSVAK